MERLLELEDVKSSDNSSTAAHWSFTCSSALSCHSFIRRGTSVLLRSVLFTVQYIHIYDYRSKSVKSATSKLKLFWTTSQLDLTVLGLIKVANSWQLRNSEGKDWIASLSCCSEFRQSRIDNWELRKLLSKVLEEYQHPWLLNTNCNTTI